jgi:NTP pyrophosphatase (non-canonical NTP hydrolase)
MPNHIIEKCKAGEDLTWAEYCAGAEVTLSHEFYGDDLDYPLALKAMSDFIYYGNTLDKIKKALFYGKNVAEVNRELQAAQWVSKETSDSMVAAPPVAGQWPTHVCTPEIIHCILGMATEAVELVEALYTALYDGAPLDVVNIQEELGDFLWYAHILFAGTYPDLNPILRKNLLKLYARYSDKFESSRAINRNLDTERTILETAT